MDGGTPAVSENKQIIRETVMRSHMAGITLAAALALAPQARSADATSADAHKHFRHSEATVAQLEAEMASGRLTSEQLTKDYIARIFALDQGGPGVNAVIELNPDAIALARQADELRRQGHVLGPLHGIPVLLKANIDTGDRMQTTAGSFALQGSPATRDSTVAAKLRGVGEFPLHLLYQRLVCRRWPDSQPIRHRS
jgi:amidase